MPMLRVGNRIIDTKSIAHIQLEAKKTKSSGGIVEGLKITLLSNAPYGYEDGSNCLYVTVAETLFFEGEEADALRWFFLQASDIVDVDQLYLAIGKS